MTIFLPKAVSFLPVLALSLDQKSESKWDTKPVMVTSSRHHQATRM